MIYGIIALVGILLLILIWINIKWAKAEKELGQVQSVVAANGSADGQASFVTPVDNVEQPSKRTGQPVAQDGPTAESVAPRQDHPGVGSNTLSTSDDEADGDVAREVEVLSDSHRTPKLFNKPQYPFQLYEASVPEFGHDVWKDCFRRLTEDPRILGWVAFQNDTLGAADGDYDSTFIDVLRTYRKTVERLRKEVGMTSIHESSVIGEEGKVWFITAIGEAWFALFLENHSDPKALSERLLEPVLVVSEE